jgi:hypothetical protein
MVAVVKNRKSGEIVKSKMEEFDATISPFTFKSLSSRAASMAKRMRLL